jgi:hypothetical protein
VHNVDVVGRVSQIRLPGQDLTRYSRDSALLSCAVPFTPPGALQAGFFRECSRLPLDSCRAQGCIIVVKAFEPSMLYGETLCLESESLPGSARSQ